MLSLKPLQSLSRAAAQNKQYTKNKFNIFHYFGSLEKNKAIESAKNAPTSVHVENFKKTLKIHAKMSVRPNIVVFQFLNIRLNIWFAFFSKKVFYGYGNRQDHRNELKQR